MEEEKQGLKSGEKGKLSHEGSKANLSEGRTGTKESSRDIGESREGPGDWTRRRGSMKKGQATAPSPTRDRRPTSPREGAALRTRRRP